MTTRRSLVCACSRLLLGCLILFSPAAMAHVVSGTVYGNGVPMPDATVSLFVTADGSPAGTTTTNEAGFYGLEAADGAYFLFVAPPAGASGYVVSRVNGIVIAGGDVTQNVALVTESSLYGFVTLPDGTPVEGLRIALIDEATSQQCAMTRTASDGAYRFAVQPGSYRFGLGIDSGTGNFPGRPYAFGLSNAYRNTIVEGSTVQNIVLPLAVLSGRTTGANGVGVSGVELRTSGGGLRADGSTCSVDQVFGLTTSGAGGSYTMALCDGFEYDVTAVPPSGIGLSANVFQDVAVSGDAIRDFVLQAGVSLSGVIRLPDGTRVPGVGVSVIDKLRGVSFGLVYCDANGAYSFSVQPGAYRLALGGGHESYPGRPYHFDYSLAPTGFVVSGPTVQDVVLPFAFLRGRTIDAAGSAVPGVQLQASGGGARVDGSSCSIVHYWGATISDAAGSYSMALCDGFEYDITAVPPDGSPFATRVFADVAVSGDEARDFVMVPPNVHGLVSMPDGRTLAGIRVFVVDEVTGLEAGQTRSDGDGGYGFLVAPGSYRFHAGIDSGARGFPGRPYSFGYSNAYRNTVVSEATTRDIVLPLALASGFTTDSNGVPVPGVQMQSWGGGTRPDGSTCEVVHYWGSVVSDAAGWYAMAQCDGFSYDITALSPGGSGFADSVVRGVEISGATGLGIVLQKPDTTPPLILSGPFATAIGADTATIVWQTDEPARGGAVWGAGSVDETEHLTQHAVLLQGLTAATSYTVTVSATDRAGNGPTTGSVTFTTASLPDTVPPLIVSGPTISALTHQSAVVEWETNEPATTGVGGDLAATVPGYRTLHRVELTGLAASTAYAITVASTDASGNGPTTRGTSFTTLPAPDVTPPVITKGPWSIDVTSTAATIQWETDEPADSGVSYNDGAVYGVLNDDALTQEHSVRMTGLTPGTTYYVTVSSRDAFGNGPTLSDVFTVTTLTPGDTEPPVFVEAPQVCNVNHQLVHLCFRTDEPASVVVLYGTSADAMDRTEARSQLVRQHSLPINGLAARTTYYLLVRVRDQAGNERASDVIVVTTPAPGSQGSPRFTAGPVVSYRGDDRVVVEWETDRPCTALVEYGTEGYDLRAGSGELRTRHGVVVTNLAPGTVYRFRVRATDVDGNAVTTGEPSATGLAAAAAGGETGTFETGPAPDGTPPAFTTPPAVTSVTGHGALVVWGTAEPADSRVTFGPSASMARTAGDIEYATAHSVALTKLQPGTAYSFQVTSVDPAGNRTTSAILTFTTTSAATPIGIPGSRCGPGPIVLGVTGATGGQDYKWYAAPDGGAPLQTGGASFTTPSISITTIYYAAIYDTALPYESPRIGIEATVRPFPDAPTASNYGPVCSGGTLQLSASYTSGAVYSWSGPGGFTSTLQLPTLSNVTTDMAGTYSVTATVDGCPSPVASTTVIVNPKPALPIITAPASVQAGQSFTASVQDLPGMTYAWSVTNGAITAGSGTREITILAAATGPVTISMNQTNDATGCASGEASISIPLGVAGARYHPLTPCRLFDTRESTGSSSAAPELAPGQTRTFAAGERCGVDPVVDRSLSVNITVTGQTTGGDLVVYRGDLGSAPITSSIAFPSGKTRANNGLLELSREGDGTFKVVNRSAGAVHFILDVNGVFQ